MVNNHFSTDFVLVYFLLMLYILKVYSITKPQQTKKFGKLYVIYKMKIA